MAEKRFPRLTFRQSTAEALIWLTLAVGAFLLTFGFDGPLPTYEFGAAFWPRLVIGGIVLAAGVLLVISVLPRSEEAGPAIDKRMTESLSEEEARVTGKTLLVFAIPLVYVYAIHKLGFVLITPFFLVIYMYLLGVRRLRTLLGVSAALYAALLLIFVKLIFTPLPQGAGFFHSLNGQLMGLLQ